MDPDAVPGLAPGASRPPSGSPVVDWITHSTRRDRTVLCAVPPGFGAHAVVVVPTATPRSVGRTPLSWMDRQVAPREVDQKVWQLVNA